MNAPYIYTELQEWHGTSGNLVAYFDSATAAFEEINNWVEQDGQAVLNDLYVHLRSWSPVLTDEESLELEDDESAGPGWR